MSRDHAQRKPDELSVVFNARIDQWIAETAANCERLSAEIDLERAREKSLQERDADLAYELSALMDHEHPEQVHASCGCYVPLYGPRGRREVGRLVACQEHDREDA